MQYVEIHIKGQIDPKWSEWFGNLTIIHSGPDQSRLAGTVIDQAALYGILTNLRDLSLALISVSVDAGTAKCDNDPDQSSIRKL